MNGSLSFRKMKQLHCSKMLKCQYRMKLLQVMEMQYLRESGGVTKLDKFKNDNIRQS